MPLYPLEEYLERVKRENEERKARNEMGRHHHHTTGFQGPRYRQPWGVYLVAGVYYVSTWSDLPFSHVGAIDKFFATDKREALIKGYSIAEDHAKANALLPPEEQVKTVLRDYENDGYGDGFHGV